MSHKIEKTSSRVERPHILFEKTYPCVERPHIMFTRGTPPSGANVRKKDSRSQRWEKKTPPPRTCILAGPFEQELWDGRGR